MIQQWIRFIRRPEVRPHVIFLSDYDMLLTEHLVQGVDVWINTPRRPWEASGTSGMKVLVNGGLNLSELDGWWAEAYSPEVGWALGDGLEHGDDPAWDAAEAEIALQSARTRSDSRVLRPRQERHSHGLDRADAREHGAADAAVLRQPHGAAVHRATLSPCRKGVPRAAPPTKAPLAEQIVDWRQDLQQHWATLRFGKVKITTSDGATRLRGRSLYSAS